MVIDLLGYALATVMGLILGLLGGGGSILTVPILVYIFHIPAMLATSYSLLIVGITSGIGALRYRKDKLIHMPAAMTFAIPSTIGVLLARRFLLPAVPAKLSVAGLSITQDQVILLVFAGLVLTIAGFMLNAKEPEPGMPSPKRKGSLALIGTEGLLVGILTGFVGAGGGFMIVPALTLLGISLREAIATSLVIICIKSLIGFGGDILNGMPINLSFTALFLLFTCIGVLTGSHFNHTISSKKLRKSFAYFVLVMGVWIIVKEL